MGSYKAKFYHAALIAAALISLIAFILLFDGGWLVGGSRVLWISLLAVPGFILHLQRVWTTAEPRDLDPQLKVLAMVTFITALLFALGLILA